ncbi:hypothetical protein NM688_g2335 [Phlebia brevispora]|uniref:Uncharacterized protein n=1 Tax=Phlebia brevispora TaxID=194682 RepID=A0ACC1T8K9_9APHY|nr:hypothetical protein NM688_g2335 [Phlebia brevispora]
MLPPRCIGYLWALIPPLLYTALTTAAPTDIPSAASFYVPQLPDLRQDGAHPLHIYAGHLPSDPNATAAPASEVTAHLFFVLIKARRTADKERILFWFNGGPGCSSFDGLMMEVGPWRLDKDGGLHTVEGGWEEYTTMVYIDQPAGTGFSYTSSNGYLHELPEASRHIIQFLRNFYEVFPEYLSMDTYLGGESYAGQYIPYFADAILSSDLNIPLRGAAIGNGWIDSRTQYPSYLDYAVKHGIVEENSEDYKRAKQATDRCMGNLAGYTDVYPVHDSFCESLLGTVIEGKSKLIDGKPKCLNMYDVRLYDDSPACGMNWPPDLPDMYTYLRRKDVVRALHASSALKEWEECRGQIHRNFATQHSNASVTVIPRVLERIPLLLFAGDQDLICNYMGIETMIQSMSWNGGTGLGTVQTQSWTVGGAPAGTWVSSRNLTYVKIFNASHMAGFDVPHVTHDMILRFMGVNFTALTDGSVRIPSAVGSDTKPLPALLDEEPSPTPGPAKTPEQDKARWEAYYNAGSAALVLLLIAILIGGFVWWRSRRGRLRGLPGSTENGLGALEENIPLTQSGDSHDPEGDDKEYSTHLDKGKERATTFTPREEIFRVDDSDDEDHDGGGRSPRP